MRSHTEDAVSTYSASPFFYSHLNSLYKIGIKVGVSGFFESFTAHSTCAGCGGNLNAYLAYVYNDFDQPMDNSVF